MARLKCKNIRGKVPYIFKVDTIRRSEVSFTSRPLLCPAKEKSEICPSVKRVGGSQSLPGTVKKRKDLVTAENIKTIYLSSCPLVIAQ
jgi:hypothetical protein